MQYWLMKSEPSTFSMDDLLRDGWTHWDGVRNHQAKKNLQTMAVGDLALLYHSIVGKEIVGITRIAKAAYPDPTDPEGKWVAVRVEPVCKVKRPVTLAEIKADPALAEISLVRQGRLSVMPLSPEHFNHLLQLAQTALPVEACNS